MKNRSEKFIVSVDPEEEIFLQGIASDRADTKKSERKTVSNKSKYEFALMAVVSEYLVARELGLLFDPSHFKGRGDGHRKDLWKGPVTISLKTRGSHLPADFIFPPGQNPGESRPGGAGHGNQSCQFPDDYGVVGRWQGPRWNPYRDLELVGYFSYFDWGRHKTTENMTNYRTGEVAPRELYKEFNLRPIEELVYDLEQVKDEKIRAIQDYGYGRYFKEWYQNGKYPDLNTTNESENATTRTPNLNGSE